MPHGLANAADGGKNILVLEKNQPRLPPHEPELGAKSGLRELRSSLKKGQYGTTRRGMPIPWGDIPARRFFGVRPEDEAEIEGVALEVLLRVLAGRG